MNLKKFINLINSRELFLCRADKFEDLMEGCIPEFYYEVFPEAERMKYRRLTDVFNSVYLRNTYINSWSCSENENYALWKIYPQSNNGIAVKTTVKMLRKALVNTHAKDNIYKVEYLDFDKLDRGYVVPFYFLNDQEGVRRNFAIFKSRQYQYESEVRLLVIDSPLKNENKENMRLSVDIEILIGEVCISPFADLEFEGYVKYILAEKGLKNIKVSRSNIVLRAK
jgi:hypothetical protein